MAGPKPNEMKEVVRQLKEFRGASSIRITNTVENNTVDPRERSIMVYYSSNKGPGYARFTYDGAGKPEMQYPKQEE